MSDSHDGLGGRLPLLDPATLPPDRRRLYERIDGTMGAWARGIPFEAATEDGRLIGPFNPTLRSTAISPAFLDFQAAETTHSSLSKREREVVILSVGSVWKAAYELYAHEAVARSVGLAGGAIAALVAGTPAEGLSEREAVAQRFTLAIVARHGVDDDTYREAERLFGADSLVDLLYLVGSYLCVCATLNAFAVPAPVAPSGA